MSKHKKLVDFYFNATLAKTSVISKGVTVFIRYSTGSIIDVLPAYIKYNYKPGTISIDKRMFKHIYGAFAQYDIYRADSGRGFKVHRLKITMLLRKWAGGIAKKTTYALISFKNDQSELPPMQCTVKTENVVINEEKYTRAILELIGNDDDMWTRNLDSFIDKYDSDVVKTDIVLSMFEVQ